MYSQCRSYIITRLEGSGIKTKIHVNQKTLDADNESHKGAVISDSDELIRSGQKVNYFDEEGKKHKRLKKFDRKLTFIVTMGEYKIETLESFYEAFIGSIDDGIYIDGNYVSISLMPATWYDKEDQIIKSEVAVVLKICFDGGLYKDSDYMKIGINISNPEMEGKE